MSKFLSIVEANLPDQDLSANDKAKRELVKLLTSKGIKCISKTFSDVVVIDLNGKKVELEVVRVSSAAEEEETVRSTAVDTIIDRNDPKYRQARKDATRSAEELARKAAVEMKKISNQPQQPIR